LIVNQPRKIDAAFYYFYCMTFDLDFYTAYNQFYICDKDFSGDTGSENFWTDTAFDSRLAVQSGVLGVGTECYGPVKGMLTILESVNTDLNIDKFDHIVEGSLEIKSGRLQVLDCPDSTVILETALEIGIYKVRVYSSNLASVDGDEGDDRYLIEIWPDSNRERKVLKRYER